MVLDLHEQVSLKHTVCVCVCVFTRLWVNIHFLSVSMCIFSHFFVALSVAKLPKILA